MLTSRAVPCRAVLAVSALLTLSFAAPRIPAPTVSAAATETQTLLLSPLDTFLNLDDTNYSTDAVLATYTWPDNQAANAILMKFNLSALPVGAVVEEATLHLALVDSDAAPESTYTVTAHKVVGRNPLIAKATGNSFDGVTAWSPNECCFGGVPLAQADISPPYDTQAIDKVPGYKAWTVTPMVQEWLWDPARNFGLLLDSDVSKPSDRYRLFASMEHPDPALRPFLRIAYRLPSSSLALAPQQDTFLSTNAKNYRKSPRLRTYTWPDHKVANAILLKFDPSSLPAGALVQEAVLRLALVDSDAAPETTYTVTAHKVIGKDPVMAKATGYTFDGVTPWTANSCCYNKVPLAQADISPAYDTRAIDKMRGYKVWAITRMVQEWVADPSSNFGVLLNSDASKARDRYRSFASMEHPDTSLRPVLRIAYTLPTTPDTTPPSVSITAPAGGATVSGNVTVAANASDDVGVVGVQFKLNAVHLGAEDTTNTYAISWDTTTIPNGTYTLGAVARDAAGNVGTAAGVTVTVANDTTPPSVAVTAPAAGATVSGTVTVTASASDNVGVAGVQFKLDGANLGTEDTTSPYSTSWNTTSAAKGSHTLTAVARDAAGNVATSAAVTVTVSNAPPPPSGGLAALYPGDVGIEADPNVVFVEKFEESTLSALFSRWTDILNGGTMSFSTDVPPGSPGTHSLNIPWVGGGVNDGGHLYKQLSPGVDDTFYVRYYVKYPTSGQFSHNGIWMGGYNPPLAWPNPQAGLKPVGNDRFSAAAEENSLSSRVDHYDYWMNMHRSLDGNYWGDLLLNSPNVVGTPGQWMCVEQMVKLNNPVTASNGEHAIWLNGVKVSHLGLGFPNGNWNGGIFTQDPLGTPFEGFRWRSDANLNLNYIWLQNYSPSDPAGFSANMYFDHVVAAKSYIGCLASGPPDAVPPTVSLTAPAVGSTLSGTAVTVSASASDNVGVVGVQFKLDGANLSAEDTTAPYSISWNTTTAGNGLHTLSAVARDAAGNTTTATGIAVTVSNLLSGAWPNEPAGFVTVNDQPWDLMSGAGWNYLRRTSSKDDVITVDPTVPFSPLDDLKIIFTTDMIHDTEPSVHWTSIPSIKEIYTAWWMKVSPNWTCSPAGCGKITFLFSDTNNVYTGIFNPTDSSQGPPFRVGLKPQWGGYDLNFYPNVTTTLINPGEWHRLEFYFKYETTPGAGNGIFRWWVDGVLNGNYTNIFYPGDNGFVEFQYAPTLQNPPPAEQYMYIDHTHASRR